jgi:hypothetical protein
MGVGLVVCVGFEGEYFMAGEGMVSVGVVGGGWWGTGSRVGVFGGSEGGETVVQEESVVHGLQVAFALVEGVYFFVVEGDEQRTEEVVFLPAADGVGGDEVLEMVVDLLVDGLEGLRVVDREDAKQFFEDGGDKRFVVVYSLQGAWPQVVEAVPDHKIQYRYQQIVAVVIAVRVDACAHE